MNSQIKTSYDSKNSFSSGNFWLSDLAIIGYIALANLALHLIAIQGFGYFRDELYYIACSDHLALGYVDHPPLSIFLLKAVRGVLGDSRLAIRLLPALGGALFVYLTGLMARELGGKKFAVLLASVAAFAPVGNFFQFHIYSMNFIDILIWQACIFIVLRIIKTNNPKYWVLFGLIAGVGLQNKVSVLFLCFGLAVGILLTKNRHQLKNPHLWLGGALALFLFLPYILWNFTHAWPTLEWMHNAQVYKNVSNSFLDYLQSQVIYIGPLPFMVGLAGLLYFFFHIEGKKQRLFGWMYVSLYLLFFLQNGKDYYLAPLYPILFAGGAVLLEGWLRPKAWFWLRPVLISIILITSLVFSPLALPLLSAEKTIAFYRSLGITRSQERSQLGVLPQHFADMFGWEEMVAQVSSIYQNLSSEDQTDCLIYVRNYGEAAAIDFFGKAHHLPKAACAHNNYWLWGSPDWNGDVAIIFGTSNDLAESLKDLSPYFEKVEHVATTSCQYCMPYENGLPIFLCRRAKFSFKDIWATEKHFI